MYYFFQKKKFIIFLFIKIIKFEIAMDLNSVEDKIWLILESTFGGCTLLLFFINWLREPGIYLMIIYFFYISMLHQM